MSLFNFNGLLNLIVRIVKHDVGLFKNGVPLTFLKNKLIIKVITYFVKS